MQYVGELISIGVAFSWTATALLSEFGSKRMGNLTLNLMRMVIALIFSCIMFWAFSGSPLPAGASNEAYLWMMLSGLVGYVIGDFWHPSPPPSWPGSRWARKSAPRPSWP